MFCPQCGSKAFASDRFCRECGTNLAIPTEPIQRPVDRHPYAGSTSVAVASPLVSVNPAHHPGTGGSTTAALAGLAGPLRILLHITAAGVGLVGLVNMAYTFWGIEILNGGLGPSFSTLDTVNGFESLGIWVFALGMIVGAVLWMTWQFRVARRAMAITGGDLAHQPHTTWCWLVPILNLFVPYQAITSYHRVGTGNRNTPAVFRWWWGLWLVGNLFWAIGVQIQANSVWLDDQMPGYILVVFGSALIAAAAVLAQRVVESTTAAYPD